MLSDRGLEAIFGSFQNIPEGSYSLHSAWDTRGFIEDRTEVRFLFFLYFYTSPEITVVTPPRNGASWRESIVVAAGDEPAREQEGE